MFLFSFILTTIFVALTVSSFDLWDGSNSSATPKIILPHGTENKNIKPARSGHAINPVLNPIPNNNIRPAHVILPVVHPIFNPVGSLNNSNPSTDSPDDDMPDSTDSPDDYSDDGNSTDDNHDGAAQGLARGGRRGGRRRCGGRRRVRPRWCKPTRRPPITRRPRVSIPTKTPPTRKHFTTSPTLKRTTRKGITQVLPFKRTTIRLRQIEDTMGPEGPRNMNNTKPVNPVGGSTPTVFCHNSKKIFKKIN